MRRAVLTMVCAAVLTVLWGCGGADTQESGGAAGANMQESGEESAAAKEQSGEESVAAAGQGGEDSAAATEQSGEESAAVMGQSGEDSTAAAERDSLAGSTFSILGDSISTFQGYNPVGYYAFFPDYGEVKKVEDTWWQQVADEMALTLYVNGSSAGATVAGDSTGTEDPQCGCNEMRTNDLSGPEGACPDRIVIYLGTNDFLNAVPLGENDGTELVEEGEVKTFSDAYTLMLDKLQANYPLAEIYCCTLLPVGDYGTDTPYVEFISGTQFTSADYGEVIIRIAANRGLSVIDLNDCGVTIENMHEMTSDGVHPTAAGMECIAAAVKEAFAE